MDERVQGKRNTIEDKKVFISDVDLEDEYTRALGGPKAAQVLVDANFCCEEGILQSSGYESLADITSEAVAQFCRDKGKVDAARYIADVLNEENVEDIGSVSRLLHELKDLSVR